jgi:hypothetical protein
MAMSRERHRALRLLPGSPLGVTEAIMLAHGFATEMLTVLVRDGLGVAPMPEQTAPIIAMRGDLEKDWNAIALRRPYFHGGRPRPLRETGAGLVFRAGGYTAGSSRGGPR